MTETRNDVTVAGAGTIAGGTFGAVRVAGTGDIRGDLDCRELRISGAATIDGHSVASKAVFNGTVTLRGNFRSDETRVGGTASIGGNAAVKDLRVYGSADVEGSIQAENLEVKGALKVRGDCSAESFRSTGAFTVDGMLNAGTIDIHLHGLSQVGEMGGERIRVRKGNGSKLEDLLELIFLSRGSLVADVIEGDEVWLEHTKARVVRGSKVAIGPGCEVDLVEYKEELRRADGAAVKEQRQV